MAIKRFLCLLLSLGVLLGSAHNALAYEDDGPPNCADGQTLVYSGGVPVCGPACPAFVLSSFGTLGGVTYNVPAANTGEIHPPAGTTGLQAGGGRNSSACTFHLECTSNGWTAMTTKSDSCPAIIEDVP